MPAWYKAYKSSQIIQHSRKPIQAQIGNTLCNCIWQEKKLDLLIRVFIK